MSLPTSVSSPSLFSHLSGHNRSNHSTPPSPAKEKKSWKIWVPLALIVGVGLGRFWAYRDLPRPHWEIASQAMVQVSASAARKGNPLEEGDSSSRDDVNLFLPPDSPNLEIIQAQTELAKAQTERLKLETEKLKLELEKAKFDEENPHGISMVPAQATNNTPALSTSTYTSTVPFKIPPLENTGYNFIHYDDYKTRFPVPDWMETYLQSQPVDDQAHHEMLTNPNNKFIVLTCYKHSNTALEDCGGLSDRLGMLPYQVWLAHKTGRRLLIKYYKPAPLEEYLVPPPDGFDWRLPDGYLMDEWYAFGNRTDAEYKDDRRANWQSRLMIEDQWINRRVVFVNNNLANVVVLRGMDDLLQAEQADYWAGLFRRMFQPSKGLAQAMQPLFDKVQVGAYSAAHLRLKWPDRKSGTDRIKFTTQKWWLADKRGGSIDMSDAGTREVVGTLADHVVECAVRLVPDIPYVYMASDAGEVVDYLIHDSPYWSDSAVNSPPRRWEGVQPGNENSTEAELHGWGVPAWEIPTTAKILARPDYKLDPAHFDSKVFDNPKDGYPAVIDIWMMAHAKCHSSGVGGFGHFGSLLSGQRKVCATRHRDYVSQGPSCPTPDERKAFKASHPNTWKSVDTTARRRLAYYRKYF